MKLCLLHTLNMNHGRMENKNFLLTYDLLNSAGFEHVELQLNYFETCIATLSQLYKHSIIDNIHINSIK